MGRAPGLGGPEILLAVIFVLKGRGEDGIGILVSSKVNQWTLLVATLPAAYNISAGSLTDCTWTAGKLWRSS